MRLPGTIHFVFEIGNNLREARLRRRLDLVEAEQDTKIRSKYLAALETEDFDVLPGPVYTRGFLRTYARYLSLDPQMYIDEYNARFGRFEDEDEPVLGRSPVRGRFPSLRGMMVLSLVALGCGPRVDLTKGLQLLTVSSGWYDAGLFNGQNKLVPSVSFTLRNVSSETLASLQVNAIFHVVGKPDELGSGFLTAAGSRGLASGATTPLPILDEV